MIGPTATTGWRYYQDEYDGMSTRTGAGVPSDRTIYVANHGSPRITDLVERVHPRQLFLDPPFGSSGGDWASDVAEAAKGGLCHQISVRRFAWSGLLITLVRSSSCAVVPAAGGSSPSETRSKNVAKLRIRRPWRLLFWDASKGITRGARETRHRVMLRAGHGND